MYHIRKIDDAINEFMIGKTLSAIKYDEGSVMIEAVDPKDEETYILDIDFGINWNYEEIEVKAEVIRKIVRFEAIAESDLQHYAADGGKI